MGAQGEIHRQGTHQAFPSALKAARPNADWPRRVVQALSWLCSTPPSPSPFHPQHCQLHTVVTRGCGSDKRTWLERHALLQAKQKGMERVNIALYLLLQETNMQVVTLCVRAPRLSGKRELTVRISTLLHFLVHYHRAHISFHSCKCQT